MRIQESSSKLDAVVTIDHPTYLVRHWSVDGSGSWHASDWRIEDAGGVTQVIAWAEQMSSGSPFEVFLISSARLDGPSGEEIVPVMARLSGTNPTAGPAGASISSVGPGS